MAPAPPPDDSPVVIKMFTAGFSGCVADLLSFPLDTAKVRLQVQGEAAVAKVGYAVGGAPGGVAVSPPPVYRGVYSTIATIIQREGPKALYNGLSAGLQRQMAFASVRIGLYDSVKEFYIPYFSRSGLGGGLDVSSRIAAGITTGAMAVMLAQPTDVVKVRMQAQPGIYKSTLKAYGHIGKTEGVVKGLWRGTIPNISRNAIVNVAEIVVYDIAKDIILNNNWMKDDVPCHFLSAVIAGFCATAAASPVDVVKTRYMNAPKGKYRGAVDCTIKMAMKEGPSAFYKGFVPSFCRIVSWNIFMWVTYEQVKKAIAYHKKN